MSSTEPLPQEALRLEQVVEALVARAAGALRAVRRAQRPRARDHHAARLRRAAAPPLVRGQRGDVQRVERGAGALGVAPSYASVV